MALIGCRPRKAESATSFVVFDDTRGCVISLPGNPSETEQRAARLVQLTLAKASGRPVTDFPLRRQGYGGQAPANPREHVIFIAGSNHRKTGEGRLDEKVTWRVTDGRVEISSYPADGIEAAAAWFLRETLEARWFMPGELGEHVPVRKELRLAAGERTHSPSYISRNMSLGGSSPAEQAWWSGNRMRRWFQHTHAMSGLFSPEDVKRNPDFAALVNGAKFFPSGTGDGNWQPNIAAVGAAEHAAAVLLRRREFSSAIGMNDSIRYDQSDRTRELLGELRWFRHRPDYSKLVFSFVNEVAKRVPGRYLGAYAYDWTEDTPGFPIERNVVPFLTADRSEWFDPAFAEADKALIRRWVGAGPEVVGIYDYYYGAPYLVPRPTLYAVSQSIPFAHQAGVRAFYAEVYANWGLDGPKAWLAAELLWDATAKPEDLLDIYYRDFWREAAGPMREYFAACDQQWLNQPKPSYWIKYYKDEHQHLLFPAEVRQKMRGLLEAAKKAATTELTGRRVEFFAQAFAVTDAFCAWQEAKDRLSRAALPAEPDPAEVREAWQRLNESEARFKEVHARVAKEMPLAVKATILGEYERNDPRRRAGWRLRAAKKASAVARPMADKETVPLLTAANPVSVPAVAGQRKRKAEGPDTKINSASIPEDLNLTSAFSFQVSALLPHLPAGHPIQSASGHSSAVPSTPPGSVPLRLSGIELLRDPALAQLAIQPPTGSMDLQWVVGGPWRGHGEPYETRRVEIQRPEGGEPGAGSSELGAISGFRSQVSGFALLMRGCKQETFSQFVLAEPGKWYAARVKVRGKVSPGNMTFLILNFQDEAGRAGLGVIDRLPVGDYPDDVELVVWAQAPANVKWVGLGVRALNQVEDPTSPDGFSLRLAYGRQAEGHGDYAAFSGFSLQVMAP